MGHVAAALWPAGREALYAAASWGRQRFQEPRKARAPPRPLCADAPPQVVAVHTAMEQPPRDGALCASESSDEACDA